MSRLSRLLKSARICFRRTQLWLKRLSCFAVRQEWALAFWLKRCKMLLQARFGLWNFRLPSLWSWCQTAEPANRLRLAWTASPLHAGWFPEEAGRHRHPGWGDRYGRLRNDGRAEGDQPGSEYDGVNRRYGTGMQSVIGLHPCFGVNANFPKQSNSSPLRKCLKPAKILYF